MNKKYFEHALQHPSLQRSDIISRVERMPTCPRCERLALRDKGYKQHGTVYCPYCGFRGKEGPSFGIHVVEV